MIKPSKCKNCQWYNKPYWSIINPCDNCPKENTNIEIITRWQDTTIEEYQSEIERLHSIIKEVRKYIKDEEKEGSKLVFRYEDGKYYEAGILEILDKENI